MKKIFLTLAAAAALAFSANAQVVVGGIVGLDFNGGSATTNGNKADVDSGVSFAIAPNVGYYFADNLLAGARVGFSYGKTTEVGELNNTDTYNYFWAVQPYVRYRFAQWNRFGVWSEANLGIGRNTGKVEVGSLSSDSDPVLSWSVNVLPVLTYSINEHLALETSLNFLTLGYHGDYTKNSDKTYEKTTGSFSFGADSMDVLGKVGEVRIGFTYRF